MNGLEGIGLFTIVIGGIWLLMKWEAKRERERKYFQARASLTIDEATDLGFDVPEELLPGSEAVQVLFSKLPHAAKERVTLGCLRDVYGRDSAEALRMEKFFEERALDRKQGSD